MPKEKINSWHENDQLDLHHLHVQVGWERDLGHVQVATVAPNHSDYMLSESDGVSNGWFVQLDRAGINRLIRVLRQARDQAFGRDE